MIEEHGSIEAYLKHLNKRPMYFTVKKDSETGKKFMELADKMDQQHADEKALAEKYGFNQWVRWNMGGGIAKVIFPDGTNPDKKLWNESSHVSGKTCYAPNKRTKAGKELHRELNGVTKVYPEDYNRPVMISDRWDHIGIALPKEGDIIGFYVSEKMLDEFKQPEDCTEVTRSAYMEIFNKNEQ